MKRNIISFVLILMPFLLLCGTHGWMSGTATNQIPAYNSDYRSWHMLGFIKQNYENSQFVNSDKGDFYYQESYPGEADSLDVQTWEPTGQTWVPYKRQIYNYFPGHEYVGWIEEKMMNQTPPQTIRNEFISYDAQNRLNMAVLFENNSSQQRDQVFRMYVIYVSNSNYQIYLWEAANGGDPAVYHHITFEYDGAGRVVWEHEQTSPDSLNWTDYSRTHHGYMTEDTTTGDSFVYRFAHEMPFLLFNEGGEPNFGIQNGAINELWNGTQWVYNWRVIYYFDLYHTHISQIEEDTYQNSAWVAQNRDTYTFDTNGNYTEILSEYWDNGLNAWITENRNNFTWGQYINTDDNVVPEVSDLTVTAFPNPFRDNINLSTASKINSPIHYTVYNLKGECVAKHTTQPSESWIWNGSNQTGNHLAAGIYFLQARKGTAHTVKRILLMR